MEGFNKAVSFILGLVVVVVFVAVLTGRINLKNRIPSFTGGIFNRPTPTPTKIPVVIRPTVIFDHQNQTQNKPDNQENANYHQYQTNNTPPNTNTTNIPNTGPELFFPIVFSGLSLGLLCKKISHKC